MKTFITVYHYWNVQEDKFDVCTFGRLPAEYYIALGDHTIEVEYDESLITDRKRLSKASKLAALQAEIDELLEQDNEQV